MIERVKQCMQLEEGALLSELLPPEMYGRINACKKFCCFFKNGENSKNLSHNSIVFKLKSKINGYIIYLLHSS